MTFPINDDRRRGEGHLEGEETMGRAKKADENEVVSEGLIVIWRAHDDPAYALVSDIKS